MQKRITPRFFINKTVFNEQKPNIKYNLRRVVGEGAQGFVFEALQSEVNKIVAVKLLFVKIQNELEIIDELMKIDGLKGIIKFFDHFEYEQYYIIVMQLGQLDLFKYLKQYQNMLDSERLNLCQKISQCVQQFHQLNLIHCDIKPENFLMIENEFKLCDFGCARKQNQDIIQNVGTPGFQAIELLKKQEKASNKLDIWSLGCVFYEIFTCQELFNDVEGKDKLEYQIDQDSIKKKIYAINTKDQMKQLILQMIEISPQKRPDINEVVNLIMDIKEQKIEDWI